MTGVTFLVWEDTDKKFPTHLKLRDAMERYREKHGTIPNVCLTSEQDAAELADDLGIEVEGRPYIARHCFYVGRVDMGTVASEARQGVLL